MENKKETRTKNQDELKYKQGEKIKTKSKKQKLKKEKKLLPSGILELFFQNQWYTRAFFWRLSGILELADKHGYQ